jgi:hypothetical protein
MAKKKLDRCRTIIAKNYKSVNSKLIYNIYIMNNTIHYFPFWRCDSCWNLSISSAAQKCRNAKPLIKNGLLCGSLGPSFFWAENLWHPLCMVTDLWWLGGWLIIDLLIGFYNTIYLWWLGKLGWLLVIIGIIGIIGFYTIYLWWLGFVWKKEGCHPSHWLIYFSDG